MQKPTPQNHGTTAAIGSTEWQSNEIVVTSALDRRRAHTGSDCKLHSSPFASGEECSLQIALKSIGDHENAHAEVARAQLPSIQPLERIGLQHPGAKLPPSRGGPTFHDKLERVQVSPRLFVTIRCPQHVVVVTVTASACRGQPLEGSIGRLQVSRVHC